MAGHSPSRRSLIKGLGAATAIGALAPVPRFIESLVAADVHATAALLGLSANFVGARESYVWTVDAAHAQRLAVSGQDLAFVQAVAHKTTGDWLTRSAGATPVQLDAGFARRLHAFYRAFASWNLEVFESFEQGKARGARGAALRGPGFASPVRNHCSGQDVPATCPTRFNYWMSWSTRAEVESWLTASGYHYTAGYAGQDGNDYTIQMAPPAAFPNCSVFGAFRSQARIFGSGSSWSYNLQEPEPNPEIWFTYSWPEWWWGNYVEWWHSNWC